MITLSQGFFTIFAYVLMLYLRSCGSTQEQQNNFFYIVAASECLSWCKNNELKKQLFRIYIPVKLAYGRISVKKEKKYLHC